MLLRRKKINLYLINTKFNMRYFYIIVFLSISMGINAQKGMDTKVSGNSEKFTAFKFDKEYIDLGKVKKGEKKNFTYTMTNTGTEDIKISYVSYCDCTEVVYPEYEILKPGKSFDFKVTFDSSTKDEEETIEIEMELENIDPKTNLPYYLTLDYHFVIVK